MAASLRSARLSSNPLRPPPPHQLSISLGLATCFICWISGYWIWKAVANAYSTNCKWWPLIWPYWQPKNCSFRKLTEMSFPVQPSFKNSSSNYPRRVRFASRCIQKIWNNYKRNFMMQQLQMTPTKAPLTRHLVSIPNNNYSNDWN